MKRVFPLFFALCFCIISYPLELMDDTDTPRPSPAYDMRQVDIIDYELWFIFDLSAETLCCTSIITFETLTDSDTIYALDLEDAFLILPSFAYYREYGSPDIESAPITYDDSLLWLYMGPFDIHDTVEIQIFQTCVPIGSGIYCDSVADGDFLYTLFWPSLARRAFPCIDHPADRATCTIHLSAHDSLIVAAGGVLTDSTTDTTGYTAWTFRYDDPVCTYNISFAVGGFATIETTALDSLPVVSYTYPSILTETAYDFGRIPEIIALWDSLFGDYPFPGVGCVVTPMASFGGTGGMEHQMLPNIGDGLITGGRHYETVVAHELAHQWFGDCIGIADWRDFWLNEGIAVYSEVLWKEYTSGASVARNYMESVENNYRLYADHYSDFPMFDPDVYLSYIPYNKGACWWNMLRWILGDEDFFGFLHYYYNRFAYKTVVTDSLQLALENYTSDDWNWCFDQWVYGQGYAKYLYDYHICNDSLGWRLNINLRQAQTTPSCTLFTNPVPIEIASSDSTWEARISPDSRNYSETIALDDTIIYMIPDRYNAICGYFTYSPATITETILPDELDIAAYPNPFNSAVNITLRGVGAISPSGRNGSGQIGVKIFDINGRLVADLPLPRGESVGNSGLSGGHSTDSPRGPTPLIWHPGKSLNSGVYFVRVSNNDLSVIKRIVYLK